MTECTCQPDWVICFRQDCPRAAWHREQFERATERALKALGDQRESVTVKPSTST